MPIHVNDRGQNNVIDAPLEFMNEQNGHITFRGNNNIVRVGKGSTAAQINFDIGDNSWILVGAQVQLSATFIFTKASSTIAIGDRTAFTWLTNLHAHEPFDIQIGPGCLFASNTWITVSDMHSIIDMESGKRINGGGHVEVGERVWIASNASVMKGSRIGHDSVIAAGAIVTGEVPAHSVAAGVPAKVVRSGIRWDFHLLPTED